MHLIVGVDPGTTTGIAAVSFEGKVLKVQSSRDMGVDQVVKLIISLGTPSLVASDVNPPPNSVLKIATSLGCKVFTPYESLSVASKNTLTTGFVVEDLHSRDALAAALNAYNKYKNKLEKISSLGHADEVKHKVLQGTSLEKALEEVQTPKKDFAFKPQSTGRNLAETIKSLEMQNRLLREQLNIKEFETTKLKRQIKDSSTPQHDFKEKIYSKTEFKQQQKVIESLEYNIRMLKDQIKDSEKIKDLWVKLGLGALTQVGVYPEVYSGLTFIKYRITPDEAVKVKNASLAFTDDPKNKDLLIKQGVNIAGIEKLHDHQGLIYIKTEDLQKLVHSPSKSLETLVNEYRSERSRKKS